jgi:hypothetical protein
MDKSEPIISGSVPILGRHRGKRSPKINSELKEYQREKQDEGENRG